MPIQQTETAACRRCGTCCRKGGPALHRADRGLVERGEIPLKHLVTIRQGEPAWDNVGGGLLPASSDIVKIRARPGGRTCVYYDTSNAACRIYAGRPLECRVLNCRDTRAIEAVYQTERLTRSDLLEGVSALWELVAEHQRKCAYEEILPLARAVRHRERAEVENDLLFHVRYDLHLRDLVTRQGGVAADLLDFLFGSPLAVTLKGLGLDFRSADGRLTLAR